MRLRLRCGFPLWLGAGECFTDCDSKARKSANVSQIATPRLGNRRMLHRLRPQGSEIGECFTDCDSKARKSENVAQIATPARATTKD